LSSELLPLCADASEAAIPVNRNTMAH
jgi:hypothetical protein